MSNPGSKYVQPMPPRQQPQSQRLPYIPSLSGGLGGGNPIFGGQTPAATGQASSAVGGNPAAAGMSNWAGAATPLAYAYLIGQGKMLEANNQDTPLAKGLLAGLGPSFEQLMDDPIGMGLPSLFGVPFLAPFVSSKKSQAARPEFAGLWEGAGLPS